MWHCGICVVSARIFMLVMMAVQIPCGFPNHCIATHDLCALFASLQPNQLLKSVFLWGRGPAADPIKIHYS